MNALVFLLACFPKPAETPPVESPPVEVPAVDEPTPAAPKWEPKTEVQGTLDERFYGEWGMEGSSAKWSIFRDEGRTFLIGVDVSDGEQFVVAGFVAEGSTLRFQSQMPSTGHTTGQTWTLAEDGSCTCTLHGDADVTLACARVE